jgi:hypothetical protein
VLAKAGSQALFRSPHIRQLIVHPVSTVMGPSIHRTLIGPFDVSVMIAVYRSADSSDLVLPLVPAFPGIMFIGSYALNRCLAKCPAFARF